MDGAGEAVEDNTPERVISDNLFGEIAFKTKHAIVTVQKEE